MNILFSKINLEYESLSSLISLISNLCVTGTQSTLVREYIIRNFDDVCKVVSAILNKSKKRYLKLNENIYNMIINSLNDVTIR